MSTTGFENSKIFWPWMRPSGPSSSLTLPRLLDPGPSPDLRLPIGVEHVSLHLESPTNWIHLEPYKPDVRLQSEAHSLSLSALSLSTLKYYGPRTTPTIESVGKQSPTGITRIYLFLFSQCHAKRYCCNDCKFWNHELAPDTVPAGTWHAKSRNMNLKINPLAPLQKKSNLPLIEGDITPRTARCTQKKNFVQDAALILHKPKIGFTLPVGGFFLFFENITP